MWQAACNGLPVFVGVLFHRESGCRYPDYEHCSESVLISIGLKLNEKTGLERVLSAYA